MVRNRLEFLDQEERKARRRERRKRIASLLGEFTGVALGTKPVGWAVIGVILVVGLLVARRLM
jgi:hypothetical protein